MKFNYLLHSIQQTHDALQSQAVAAVNRSLTIRNWLIGFYIVEFEQKGEDRAKYGNGLLKSLSLSLKGKGLVNILERELRRFRLFYLAYAHLWHAFDLQTLPVSIRGTLSPILEKSNPGIPSKELSKTGNQDLSIAQTMPDRWMVPPEKILNRLSFSSYLVLLMRKLI